MHCGSTNIMRIVSSKAPTCLFRHKSASSPWLSTTKLIITDISRLYFESQFFSLGYFVCTANIIVHIWTHCYFFKFKLCHMTKQGTLYSSPFPSPSRPFPFPPNSLPLFQWPPAPRAGSQPGPVLWCEQKTTTIIIIIILIVLVRWM